MLLADRHDLFDTQRKGEMDLEKEFMDRPSPAYPDDCPGQVVAMAYVPWQRLENVYEPEVALQQGTLFPELDKPWMVGGGHCD